MKGYSWSIFSRNFLNVETYASSDGMVDELKFMVLMMMMMLLLEQLL